MWWKLLFLIVATAATSDDEYEAHSCGSLIHEQCYEEGSPNGLLSTERDLEEYCKQTEKYFGCAGKILDTCKESEDESTVDAPHFRDLITNNRRICDEDSLLYSVLDENLPCLIKNKDKLYSCPAFNEENIESFKDALAGAGINEIAAPNSEPESCLEFMFFFGCFASNAGKSCNGVARDVVIDIMQGFVRPFEDCHPSVKENLHAIVNVMQTEMENDEDVESKNKKKK